MEYEYDDLPDHPGWGAVSPSIGADLLAAARRQEDLRAVALAYRHAGRFTCDHFLKTEIAANALQRRHPTLPRSEVLRQVTDLIAFASRAYTAWLNDSAAEQIEQNARLGIERFVWSEELRLKHMGVALP
jgi:hypothetical protein